MIGIVSLGCISRATACQLVDCDPSRVEIGLPVELTVRRSAPQFIAYLQD